MSFVRSFFKILISILLAIILIASVIGLSLFQLTSHNVLEPKVSSFIEEQVSQSIQESTPEELDNLKNELITNCSGKEQITVYLGDYSPDNALGISEITLNCSHINSSINSTDIIPIISNSVFNTIYYQVYDCTAIDCIKQSSKQPEKLIGLMSKQTSDYFKLFSLITLLISAIFIALIVILSKPKFTCFYNLAFAFLIAGFLFISRFIASPILSTIELQEPILGLVNFLINALFINFLIVFILGIICLVLAIILKKKQKP